MSHPVPVDVKVKVCFRPGEGEVDPLAYPLSDDSVYV